jgi:hypothetical protein
MMEMTANALPPARMIMASSPLTAAISVWLPTGA